MLLRVCSNLMRLTFTVLDNFTVRAYHFRNTFSNFLGRLPKLFSYTGIKPNHTAKHPAYSYNFWVFFIIIFQIYSASRTFSDQFSLKIRTRRKRAQNLFRYRLPLILLISSFRELTPLKQDI